MCLRTKSLFWLTPNDGLALHSIFSFEILFFVIILFLIMILYIFYYKKLILDQRRLFPTQGAEYILPILSQLVWYTSFDYICLLYPWVGWSKFGQILPDII